MRVTYAPETAFPEAPPTETLPKRRVGGWTPHPQPRIGLDLGSDDDLLILENKTEVSWVVYHSFHQLGIIDPGELLVFHLNKRGNLNARPSSQRDDPSEFLEIPLNYEVYQVHIYKRTLNDQVEVYDMRVIRGRDPATRSRESLP